MPEKEDLFRRAIELSGIEREQFLDSLSDDQRVEVNRLMNAAAEAADRMGTPAPPMPDLDSVPDQIGPFKVLEAIGEGGMGQVFVAEQLKPVKRRVALKVIRTEMPSKQILARFEAERQALAMMDHQNIAKVLDAGITNDGRPYFAMELVKGIPITDYCDQNKLTPEERLHLFVQACRAIQHAHQKGIIHRDVKPSNVLATLYDGNPTTKVIDFGLAKALHEHAKLTERTLYTQHGQIVGTLEYMSPEQAERNALDVDTRTDVFSLGVILYELMTGSTPIGRDRLKSETMDRILVAIREEDPPRMSTRLSQSGETLTDISARRKIEPRRLTQLLKGDLEWIAAKALEKDRTRRYDGAGELADDVERYLNSEPIEARPPSVGYRLQKAYRRHKLGFVTAATILGLLIAGLIGTGTMWLRASDAEADAIAAKDKERDARLDVERERDKVSAERDKARSAEERAVAISRELEATLSRSNFTLGVARWEANRPSEALDYLDRVPKNDRDIAWRLTRRAVEGSHVTFYGHRGPVLTVDWSPDGKRLVSADQSWPMCLWDAETGRQILSLGIDSGPGSFAAFSPDGRHLATGGMKQIVVRDASTGDVVRQMKRVPDSLRSLEWNRDGSKLLAASYGKNTFVWDTKTGDIVVTLQSRRAVVDAGFSPDGDEIATAGWDAFATRWDLNGKRLGELIGHGRAVTCVAYHPGGSKIATASTDGVIILWDRRNGRELRRLTGQKRRVDAIAFSPAGDMLASGSTDHTVRIWNTSTGKEVRTYQGHADAVRSLCFSPDGSRVASASADRTVKVWRIDGLVNERVVSSSFSSARSIQVCPDSRFVAACEANAVRIKDAMSGLDVRIIEHADLVLGVTYSRDGKRLISTCRDGFVRVWDALTGRELSQFSPSIKLSSRPLLGPDNLLVFSGKNAVHVWDPEANKAVASITRSLPIAAFAVSPDGRWMALATERSKTIELLDATDGSRVGTLDSGYLHSVIRFSPDGRFLAAGHHDPVIRIWDFQTREQLHTLGGHTSGIDALNFSSDGDRLLSGGDDGTIRVWDSEAGAELLSLKAHEGQVNSIHLSPDQSFCVSSGLDGQVRFWDAPFETEFRLLRGHSRRVVVASASPTDDIVASGGEDQSVRLWDPESGEMLRELNGHTDTVTRMQFSPDGSQLGTRSNKETLFWDVKSGQRVEVTKSPGWYAADNERQPQSQRWRAVRDGQFVRVVDLRFKETSRELAYREFQSRPASEHWHRDQFGQAFRGGDTFGAVFHAASKFVLNPKSLEDFRFLYREYNKLGSSERNLVPDVVVSAINLPPPPLPASQQEALEDARVLNQLLWPIVNAYRSAAADNFVKAMEAVCERFPQSRYLNTLGMAYYRAGKLQNAIEASNRSLEDDPDNVVGLAILALAYTKQGDNDQAAEFRQKFEAALKAVPKKDAGDAMWLAKEVQKTPRP